jgi:hypothetical protein
MYDTIESEARHQIKERVTRAAEPRVPQTRQRHRVAERLRRLADRIDN